VPGGQRGQKNNFKNEYKQLTFKNGVRISPMRSTLNDYNTANLVTNTTKCNK